MQHNYLIIMLLCCFSVATAQNIPADYHNTTLLNAQKDRCLDFLNLLENGFPEAALDLVDSNTINANKIDLKTIRKYSKSIQKYSKTTKRSIVIVYEKPGFNTYRCRYSNKQGTFYHIDLSIASGKPRAPITIIEVLSAKALKKDRKEGAKAKKEAAQGKIPPIPPPPPMMPKD